MKEKNISVRVRVRSKEKNIFLENRSLILEKIKEIVEKNEKIPREEKFEPYDERVYFTIASIDYEKIVQYCQKNNIKPSTFVRTVFYHTLRV
jgi:hypothetical protein